jgi:hypothetical protein
MAVVSDLPIKRLTRATRKGQSKLAASKETSPTASKPYTKAAGGECSRRKKHYPRKAQTASYVEPVWAERQEWQPDGVLNEAPFNY